MASCHLLFSWEPLTFPIFLAGKRLQRGRPSTLCNASSHLMMPIIFSFFLTPSFSNFFFSILNPLFSTPQVQSIHFKKDLKNEGKIKRERSAWWEVGGGPGCPDPIDQIICTVKLPKHPWVTSLPQACVSCFFFIFLLSLVWHCGPGSFFRPAFTKTSSTCPAFFFHFLSSKFLIFFGND